MAIADAAAMPPKAFVEMALGLPNVHLNIMYCLLHFFAFNEVDKVFGFTV